LAPEDVLEAAARANVRAEEIAFAAAGVVGLGFNSTGLAV
jgi:hypothetical protein